MGYCMGVKRAVQMAEAALKEGPVTSLGPLIHNRAELARLSEAGLRLWSGEGLPSEGGRLLIRAHGIKPQMRQMLESSGAQLFDATCPLVVKNQQALVQAAAAGLQAVIAGKPDHAEVQALLGYAENPVVVSSAEQAGQLALSSQTKIFLLAQTTLRPALFEEIKRALQERFAYVEAPSAICPATQKRQEAVLALAAQVDALVIVGDKTSANTRGLVESAATAGKPAFLAQTRHDLPADLKRYGVIGLAAGASAPQWLIDDIEMSIIKEV